MQIPLQISFENSEPSEAVRAVIGHEVERLEKHRHHITGCRVAVVGPSTKHRHGAVYRINIWVTIPPHENIVVSHQPSDDQSHVHVEVAIKDAFSARPTPNRGSGTTRERQGRPQEDRNELAPLTNEEEHILRCLGAAVIMQWNDLPTKIQREFSLGTLVQNRTHPCRRSEVE